MGADEHDAEAGRLIPSIAGTLGGTSPGGGWRFGADEAAAGQLVPRVAGTLGNNGKAAGTATGQDAAVGLLVPEIIPLRASGAANANVSGVGFPGDPSLTLDCDGSAAEGIGVLRKALSKVQETWGSPSLQNSEEEVVLGLPSTGEREGAVWEALHGGKTRWEVRRLTVRECESLMGVPVGYTAIPWRGGDAADGPRYRCLGNGFAVPVVRWVGERIAEVDRI